MRLFRRLTAALLLAFGLLAAPIAPALAQAPTSVAGDMVLGNAKAPVTVIEYASLSCPHCAAWNAEVWPAFKAKYVDTGKVRYVFREIVTEPAQLAEAGFLLARCAGTTPTRYFGAIDALFGAQDGIYKTGDMRTPFVSIAAQYGLSEQQLMACVSDDKALAALRNRVQTFAAKDKIEATPTFVVAGKKLEGEQPMAALDAAIAAAQAKK